MLPISYGQQCCQYNGAAQCSDDTAMLIDGAIIGVTMETMVQLFNQVMPGIRTSQCTLNGAQWAFVPPLRIQA